MHVVDYIFLAVIRFIVPVFRVTVNSRRPQLLGEQLYHKGITLLSNHFATQALAIHKIIEVAIRIDYRVVVPIIQTLLVPNENVLCRFSQSNFVFSLDRFPRIWNF